MLMLYRKNGEEIFVNEGQITIKVITSEKGEVLLGVRAPQHIAIDRREIFLRKQQEKTL